MKKLLVLGFALFLVAAFTLPATAEVQHKFGGYFRTRFMHYDNARGQDDTSISLVDTRTRLDYTAVLNENLKFFFQNEFDSNWGGANYGQVGADGLDHQVKNIYIDFNVSDYNFIVGTQGFQFGRSGFIFDDDASGVSLIWRGNKNVTPALYWLKYNEGDDSTAVGGSNSQDSDLYTALVNIKSGDMQIVPYLVYWYCGDGAGAVPAGSDLFPTGLETANEELSIYYAGLDFNMKFDPVTIMLTGIYQGGEYNDTNDASAYLLDAAFKSKLGKFGIHGEVMYATGDDDPADSDIDTFLPPPGASYTWSEGFAKGSIDDQPFRSALGVRGSKEISDLMAFNLGADFNVTKGWKATFDFWNINLAEDNAAGDADIGNEVSLKLKGEVIDNLDLLLVGAYMVAGDAFNGGLADDEDPWELGALLSIKF